MEDTGCADRLIPVEVRDLILEGDEAPARRKLVGAIQVNMIPWRLREAHGGGKGEQRVAPATIMRHIQLAVLFSLQRVLAAEVQWERVVTVGRAQEQPAYVYDITVGDNHTFVLANGWAVSNSAEPGCLFWDTIQRFSVSDRYPGMEVVSTNPCVTGDTVVAVA